MANWRNVCRTASGRSGKGSSVGASLPSRLMRKKHLSVEMVAIKQGLIVDVRLRKSAC